MIKRIIDGAELFTQACRTHDEFIGLDDLAELLDKMPTVEAIPVEWLEQLLDDAELSGQPYTINILKRILSRWEEENGTENN